MNETDLDALLSAQSENVETSKEVLGTTINAYEAIQEVYDYLCNAIEKHGVGSDAIVCGATFLLGCQYNLAISITTLLRGHVSDSYLFLRRSIEFCGFAARVEQHPHLAQTWLTASEKNGDSSYRKYLSKFGARKLFPETDARLSGLYDRYNLCAKFSHPSLYSVSTMLGVTKDDGIEGARSTTLSLNYFQVPSRDGLEPHRTFLYIVNTHHLILTVFEEVLTSVIDADRLAYELRRNAADASFALHRGALEKRIASRS